MKFQRILGREYRVEATLNHAGAAALADQAFDGEPDIEPRVGTNRVEAGHEPRASGAEDQNVERQGFQTDRLLSAWMAREGATAFGQTTVQAPSV